MVATDLQSLLNILEIFARKKAIKGNFWVQYALNRPYRKYVANRIYVFTKIFRGGTLGSALRAVFALSGIIYISQ